MKAGRGREENKVPRKKTPEIREKRHLCDWQWTCGRKGLLTIITAPHCQSLNLPSPRHYHHCQMSSRRHHHHHHHLAWEK